MNDRFTLLRCMRLMAAAMALSCLVAVLPTADAALTYTVESGGWPNAAHRNAAVATIQSSVDRYNAYSANGFGNYNIYVYYNAGIPTAQANYLGSIGFGGTYPNERVMMHELAHYLGSGTFGDPWDGAAGEALVDQFDGIEASLNGDGAHFWPYGLNFDSEGSEINKQRQVAMVYAQRADLGIGPTTHPATATQVSLTASDPSGTSGFNYQDRWSDGYFAHANAAYSTGDFALRTPASSNSFTFAGDSLAVNNTNSINGGLLYKGMGRSSATTINNLILDGGYVRHASGSRDLFQLAGNMTLVGSPTIDAAQGKISLLSQIDGSGSLRLAGGSFFSVSLDNANNAYTGTTVVQDVTLELNGSTGFGLTTIQGGAKLVGSGQVRGGLTAESNSTVRVGGIGLPMGLASGQKLIDDFEAYPAGQIGATPNTTGDVWTGAFNGTANAEISSDAGNRALLVHGINQRSNSWRGAVTDLNEAFDENFSLANGETGTYFFRVRRNGTGTVDTVFGLSDLSASDAPGSDLGSPWDEYAATLSIIGDTETSVLRAQSNTSGSQDIMPAGNAEWLNVWLTVDNSDKTYRVATSTGSDDGSDSGSVFQFGRRTAGAVGSSPLITFGFHERLNVNAELDDLYFVEGVSLTNPLTQMPTLVGETLAVGADFNLDAGSALEIDVAANANDVVEVTGSASLDGLLSVTLDSSYTPELNDSFTVLTASSLTRNLSLGGPAGSRFGLAASTATELVLTVVSGLEGDYNNDGAVDAADYTVWRDNVDEPAGTLFNDSQGGTIGVAQYQAWQSNYGSVMPASALAESVPEAGAGLLLLVGLTALLAANPSGRGTATSPR